MAIGGDRHGRAAKRGQGGRAIHIGQDRNAIHLERGGLDRHLGAAGDDADRNLTRLLRGWLRRGDEREVLATGGQYEGNCEDEQSEPERAAGQQDQVLSAGGSVSSSAGTRAATRKAATVGARSPAVLYRALPTTSTSPPLSCGDADRVEVHAPVDADLQLELTAVDLVTQGTQLRHDLVKERLPAPPGMDGHDQQQVHLVEPRQYRLGRGLGVERDPGPLAGPFDLRDHRTGLVIGLDVEDDQVAAGLSEALGVGQRPADHQVAVERQRAPGANRLDGDRAERQVVDEVAVHDVEMDRVDAADGRPSDLLAQPAEVGVEDARAEVRWGPHAEATAARPSRASRRDRPASCAWSWPQAASISRPRVSRTVTVVPPRTIPAKREIPAAGVPLQREPGVG